MKIISFLEYTYIYLFYILKIKNNNIFFYIKYVNSYIKIIDLSCIFLKFLKIVTDKFF